MKIRMNRPHAGFEAGKVYDIDANLAEYWVAKGLAVAVPPKEKKAKDEKK